VEGPGVDGRDRAVSLEPGRDATLAGRRQRPRSDERQLRLGDRRPLAGLPDTLGQL